MRNARVILAAGLVLGVIGAGIKPLLAQQDPPPPEPRLKNYHPDETTCQGALIRSSFAKNLLPWADQPEPVLASLRQVQADMTRATLASCVRQNLMTPAQAAALQRELGLVDPPGAETLPQPSGVGAPIRP
jgi:hypothetical protein